MKKKIHKILGVGLALVMVLSLGVALMPVNQAQAAEGNMQWAAQPTPSDAYGVLATGASGTDIVDIAVASDGKTIYAANSTVNMNAAVTAPVYPLYKSTNAGQSWTGIDLSGVTGDIGAPIMCVAVAPDDPNFVAIAASDRAAPPTMVDRVYRSVNGGINWTILPIAADYNGAVAGSNDAVIMDLAVGPYRGGLLYQREYLIAISDANAATTDEGNLMIIGASSAWATVDPVNVSGTDAARTARTTTLRGGAMDYVACAFSPGYAGDRVVIGLGAGNSTPAAMLGSFLHLIDDQEKTQVRAKVELDTACQDYDESFATPAIFAGDIALPSDWDPSTSSGQRTYCCTASFVAGSDSVYRVDGGTRYLLGTGVDDVQWNSVAYSGTIEEGKLFAGEYAAPTATTGMASITTTVKYTSDPQIMMPTWKTTAKSPTGDGGQAFVRLASDYASTDMVFCGTTGNESAFSVSYDAGFSFDQEALIDTGVATDDVFDIDDIQLVKDADGVVTMFMATNDDTELSLWETSIPPSPYSWVRKYCVPADGPGAIALNPGYAGTATEALIFADTGAAPPLSGANTLFVSSNGGASFAIRTPPSTAAIDALALETADIVYLAQGANIYKSTNLCWGWGAASPALAGDINSLDASAVDADDNPLLLVGGTGACSYSTDGAATFTKISTGLAAGAYSVLPDEGYADNSIIYAGGAASGLVYRFEVGVSSGWSSLINPITTGIKGLAMNNGAVYGMAAASCDRTLGPHAAPGTLTWGTMDKGTTPAAATLFGAVDNHAYAADGGTDDLYGYDDYMATTKTTITAPKGGAIIDVDPVTGRGKTTIFSWEKMGSSTGLADIFHVLIWPKALGSSSATVYVTPSVFDKEAPYCASANFLDLALNAQAFTPTAGTEYEWFVRAADELNDEALVSPFSDKSTFTVAAGTGIIRPEYEGPILQAPQPGGVGVSLTPGFAWVPVPGAVSYEFELSTSAETTARGYFIDALVGLTGDNALVSAGWQCDVALDYGTSYFWHIKAITASGESIWGTAQFTTLAEAEVPAPPAPPVELPAPVTPAWIWAIVVIGAVLVIVVIVLIVVTRKP